MNPDGNTKRGKVSGRDNAPRRAGVLSTAGMDATVSRKLQTCGAGATVALGNDVAKRAPAHARQRINAAHRFSVEINHLLRRLSMGHRRNVDGEHARITAATMASAAPTHSRLKSTFKSMARTENFEA